ncbi:MAG: right-handed parallel beta-helix repeat-containing protein [Polyangiales bacterium]
MRYVFGFLCACAIGLMSTVGCGREVGVMLCEGVSCEDTECRTDGVCDVSDGMCDYTPVADGTECGGGQFAPPGFCVAGECRATCETVQECDDLNDCTADACTPIDGGAVCDNTPVADGTTCAGGMCQAGACALSGTVLPCSEQGIRNAIAAGGGPYTFACSGPTTVEIEAQIIINNDVILDGEDNLTVDGNDSDSLFSNENTTELHGLTVIRRLGVGIENDGTLTLMNSTVSGNNDPNPEGRQGIENRGTLTLMNSTVSGNDTWGGIHNYGIMTLTNSTVSDNACSADCEGGGIRNEGTMTMTNSTVSGNTSDRDGGGIIHARDGTLTIVNSTVSGNTAMLGGTAIAVEGTMILTNTLIDGTCTNSVTSNGYNIESPGNTCRFDQQGDQSGVSAVLLDLQPLANNGGPTQTHAITTDSAAFNAGTCEVDEDQRGVTRPQGPACDVGAFELEQ